MASACIDDIVKRGEALQKSGDEAARKETLRAAYKLVNELETPFEKLARVGWEDPSATATLRIAFEMGLLAKLSDTPMSSSQLAEGTGADTEIVARTLKHLASYDYVKETGKDQYCATPFTLASRDPTFEAGLIHSFDFMVPVFKGLPEFMAKTKYQLPTDPNNCAVQYGMNNPKPFFGILEENPRLGSAFNKFMAGYAKSRPRWVDVYPCKERLGGTTGQGPLLVDVGGGLGHEITAFHQKCPDLSGSLILEDTPTLVAQAKESSELPPAIKPVEHDFFTPQPKECQGAHAYFLRQILHDWPDEKCQIILSHIRDAMKPGFSKLLINEHVVLDVGASFEQTSLDWTMLALLISRERTESQWRDLLATAGLKISGIWRRDIASEGIIEAVLIDD